MTFTNQICEYLQQRLTAADAAELIGVQTATLAKWRCEKTQVIPYYRIGGRVYYRRDDVMAYIHSKLRDAEREVV